MSTKHTPEPWQIKGINSIIILDERDYPICLLNYEDGLLIDNAFENSKRIVSCVNAMAGIEDPQKLREAWEAVKLLELDQAQKYKEQRNTLLKAFNILFFAQKEIDLTFSEMNILKAAQKVNEEIEQNENSSTDEP